VDSASLTLFLPVLSHSGYVIAVEKWILLH
jgi:hypothetical protein